MIFNEKELSVFGLLGSIMNRMKDRGITPSSRIAVYNTLESYEYDGHLLLNVLLSLNNSHGEEEFLAGVDRAVAAVRGEGVALCA